MKEPVRKNYAGTRTTACEGHMVHFLRKKIILLCALLLGVPSMMDAQKKIDIKLGGRVFMDGGLFFDSEKPNSNKVGLTDVRLSAKVRWQQDWYLKVDIGFAHKKISFKDVFLQKRWNNHYLRLGHMLGMCSMEQSISTNDYVFLSAADAAETFYTGRHIGASYTYAAPHFTGAFALFAGDELNSEEKEDMGYNTSLRGVYRPVYETNRLLHLGAGFLYRRPDREKAETGRSVSLGSVGSTFLSVPFLIEKRLPNVDDWLQCSIETLFQSSKVFCQGEYYCVMAKHASENMHCYQGAYIQGGFLLKGWGFGYDAVDALPLTPLQSNSWLLAGRFNWIDLSEKDSQPNRQYDFTLGINYYASDHLIFKLNGTMLWTSSPQFSHRRTTVVQGRVQVRF